MRLIDMHCDTAWKLMDLEQDGSLMHNKGSVSIPAMKDGGTIAQFFACFGYVDDFREKEGYDGCYQHILKMIDFLKSQVKEYPDIMRMAYSRDDIDANEGDGLISAVVTVEEGGIINGKIERLDELYAKGVRMITLMWNYENCIGHPNSWDSSGMWQGLKPFGIEVVRHMNDLGMLIDVSHSSEGTIRDIIANSRKPVAASHSNCRAVCDHPRNMIDEMIRGIANGGGVMGLNFYGPFLGTKDESRIDEMVMHVLHMLDVGGSDLPAIGTDFDGFDGMKSMDIPDAGHMELLWAALKKAGVSERQLDKIWSENVLRVLKYI